MKQEPAADTTLSGSQSFAFLRVSALKQSVSCIRGKAAEGRAHSKTLARDCHAVPNLAKRLGPRQPSGALERRHRIGLNDQKSEPLVLAGRFLAMRQTGGQLLRRELTQRETREESA